MHIIIGLLGSLVTIFYLLDRLGVDIGGLNPFYWYRRRAFAKKFGAGSHLLDRRPAPHRVPARYRGCETGRRPDG